jgi:hypothetical protein
MQTNMISAWTNFKLVLALESKISIGTNAVLKELRMGNVVVAHFLPQRVDERVVFSSLST